MRPLTDRRPKPLLPVAGRPLLAHVFDACLDVVDEFIVVVGYRGSDVVERLEGSFALGVVAAGHDSIVGARRGSPLVLGFADHGTFLASDVPAFVEHTRRVSCPEDGDVIHVAADGATVYTDGEEVSREIIEAEWDAEAAEKDGYEHYMLKEIHEQPTALR